MIAPSAPQDDAPLWAQDRDDLLDCSNGFIQVVDAGVKAQALNREVAEEEGQEGQQWDSRMTV